MALKNSQKCHFKFHQDTFHWFCFNANTFFHTVLYRFTWRQWLICSRKTSQKTGEKPGNKNQEIQIKLFEQHLYWLLLVTCYIKCSQRQAVISTPVMLCYSSWETNIPHPPKNNCGIQQEKCSLKMELEGNRNVISWLKTRGKLPKRQRQPILFSPSHTKQCLTNKAVFSQNFPPATDRKRRAGKACCSSHNTSFCSSPQVVPTNDHI